MTPRPNFVTAKTRMMRLYGGEIISTISVNFYTIRYDTIEFNMHSKAEWII